MKNDAEMSFDEAKELYPHAPDDPNVHRALFAEIHRLRAELAALREPAGEELVEVANNALWDARHENHKGRARAVLDAVLPRVRAELATERSHLVESLTDIVGCFDAAACEGWHERLAEMPDEAPMDAVRDIWDRRISWAEAEARAALQSISPPPEAAP